MTIITPPSFSEDDACFVVAEVGINHNGNMDLAKQMIHAAAEAGADAVKFQNYRIDEFLLDETLSYTYRSEGRQITETQVDLFFRNQLDPANLTSLKKECEDAGIVFFSTPSGPSSLKDLIDLDVLLLKNGSDALGHLPLIKAMAASGRTTILSTGMAVEREVAEAVEAFRAAGGTKLVLLHCTSAYPTPVNETNLRRIAVLEKKFNCPVGFSDHTQGKEAAMCAVALGARMIEKHFTLDKALAGPDHWFSADPAEFAELVAGVRQAEGMLGSTVITPSPKEREILDISKVTCLAARDLSVGDVLCADDIFIGRPGTGLPPRELPRLIGACLSNDVPRGGPIRDEDLTP
ncbi:N-acetylneuraminate synthase family protein [Pseudodesulfovibrio sp.]|nr:N-acetylneuraminate synthase family protein [Pseudodesulfovibrio sp.]